MPGMNGVELAGVIRDRYPGLPVVLTSGYSNVLAENADRGKRRTPRKVFGDRASKHTSGHAAEGIAGKAKEMVGKMFDRILHLAKSRSHQLNV